MPRVSGYSRVPEPPARMMPFLMVGGGYRSRPWTARPSPRPRQKRILRAYGAQDDTARPLARGREGNHPPFPISPKPRGVVILSERAERARAKDLLLRSASEGSAVAGRAPAKDLLLRSASEGSAVTERERRI